LARPLPGCLGPCWNAAEEIRRQGSFGFAKGLPPMGSSKVIQLGPARGPLFAAQNSFGDWPSPPAGYDKFTVRKVIAITATAPSRKASPTIRYYYRGRSFLAIWSMNQYATGKAMRQDIPYHATKIPGDKRDDLPKTAPMILRIEISFWRC